MAQGFIQVPADSTGKRVDTSVTTTAAQHRHVVAIGHPTTDAALAPVDATKGLAVDLTATGANATALKVDGSAVTQPISGTVTANAGSGTLAVSAASLPLPSGASTAAKQPALGTAGTASADVISVQGIASMTKLLVTPDPITFASAQAVTQSGTWTTRVVGNAGANLDAATAAAVPANALYKGARGTTALPTAVTDGQLVGAMADKFGRQVTIAQSIRDLVSQGTVTLTTTTETTVLAAVASVFLDVVEVVVINTSATGVRVDFRDATTGTIRFFIYCPPTDTRGLVSQVPWPQATVNTNWTAQLSGAVTDVRIAMKAVQNK
jgi:hypothetical protein